MLPKARSWISQHRALIVLVFLVGLAELVNLWPRDQVPRITRTFASSTRPLRVVWLSEDISPFMASSPGGTGFAMSSKLDGLLAIDMQSGRIKWKDDLPPERRGARAFLGNDRALFVVTTYSVESYRATTGELIWSTPLGKGGVSVIAQLDSNILRVYYGDKLYELDPDSGRELILEPNGGILWVSGQVVIRLLSTNQLVASDKLSGRQLWTSDHVFYIHEWQQPQSVGAGFLIVAREHSFDSSYANGLCALSLQTGTYVWCLDGTYISRLAVDPDSQVGYVLRSDFALLSIDLRNGSILGETRFLPAELPKVLEQYSHNYSVAFSKGIIAVAFSDSGQTFGLSQLE